jgi:hypothetical protein
MALGEFPGMLAALLQVVTGGLRGRGLEITRASPDFFDLLTVISGRRRDSGAGPAQLWRRSDEAQE